MGHHKEHHAHTEEFKVGKDNTAKAAETTEAAPKQDELAGLKAQQEKLMKKLQDLRLASNDAWAELKTGAENAFDELRGSVHKVIQRFETALSQEHETK
jgi:hypothetical protein